MTIQYKGLRPSDVTIDAGFTMRGANTDPDNPPPEPKRYGGPELYRDTKYPSMVQNGLSGGGGSGGSEPPGGGGANPTGNSGNDPSARRPFNYERHPSFPWGRHDDYNPAGNDSRAMPWGREYSDHVIDRMQPSDARFPSSGTPHEGRSIPPRYIEHTIAYGDLHFDKKGRKTYSGGDLEVGVKDDDKFVNHAKYTRKLIKW